SRSRRSSDLTTNATAKDIELTSDGSIVIVGDIEDSQGNSDIILMTLSFDGTRFFENSRTVFGLDTLGQNTDETATSVTQTNDGFIVSGSTSKIVVKAESGGPNDTRDALHVRYFDDLTIYPSSWRIGHGPGNFDVGIKTIQVAPDRFYFFSYSNKIKPPNSVDFNYYLLGLGSDGETNSPDNFLPGTAASDERLSSVIISPPQSGEGFLLAGVSTSTGGGSDVFVVKLRKDLNFGTTDVQFEKVLNTPLGATTSEKVSAFPLSTSGFLILTNEKTGTAQNFSLNRITNDGFSVWASPVIFGGEKDDRIGTVLELPDGSIGIIGTFGVGEDGETKMTFIKVNREGKFLK
ncbi:MAG: hypothetical protein RIA63_04245, partial [Cyclobacteriaceae bacterium]